MICPRCDEHKTSLSVLSKTSKDRVCVDCFVKEFPPLQDEAAVPKPTAAIDIPGAMAALDSTMRDITRAYPDLDRPGMQFEEKHRVGSYRHWQPQPKT